MRKVLQLFQSIIGHRQPNNKKKNEFADFCFVLETKEWDEKLRNDVATLHHILTEDRKYFDIICVPKSQFPFHKVIKMVDKQ